MPIDRMQDSVDSILRELDQQPMPQGVSEEQVNEILRSIGIDINAETAMRSEMGPIDTQALPALSLTDTQPGTDARFSTAVLDELLSDLPSLQAAQPAAPAPQPKERAPQPKAPAPALAAQPKEAAPQPAVAAQPQKPAPQPAPAAQPQKAAPQPAVAAQPQKPAAQPAPAQPQKTEPRPAQPQLVDDTQDTTRTGIIKNFLQKMAPDGSQADQGALNLGKKEFQRFFAESAAVVPDENGRLRQPAKKRRGLFGLGSVEDTDEFVPINVSLTGHREEEEPAVPPVEQATEVYDTDEEPSPVPQKRGFFARLLGVGQTTDELYIPQSREAEEIELPTGAAPASAAEPESTAAPLMLEPSLQLPLGEIRSKYTEAGAGLDTLLPADEPQADDLLVEEPSGQFALNLSAVPQEKEDTEEFAREMTGRSAPAASAQAGASVAPKRQPAPAQPAQAEAQPAAAPQPAEDPYADLFAGLDYAIDPVDEPSLLSGLLPGDSAVEMLRRDMRIYTAPPEPARPTDAAAATVYRRKRQTVEFVPRRPDTRPAPEEADETSPLPQPDTGPVGEVIMTPLKDVLPPEEQTADLPLQPEMDTPAPAPVSVPVSTGFTVEVDPVQTAEDTQSFMAAFAQARSQRKKGAPPQPAVPAPEAAPAPLPESEAQPPQPAVATPPAAPAPLHTGDVPLVPVDSAAPEDTAAFVNHVERSINDLPVAGDNTAARPETADTQPEEYFRQAAERLLQEEAEQGGQRSGFLRLGGTPEDEQETSVTSPFVAAPEPGPAHSYDKPDDAPAVRRELDTNVLVLTVSAIVTGVAAAVLIFLGAAALGDGAYLPAPLSTQIDKTPLLVTMLVLFFVACAASWRTLAWGLLGVVRAPSPDSMPALAAVGALIQLLVFLVMPGLYDTRHFTLMAGAAALLLCGNTAGKALDARTLRAGFGVVSNGSEHSVARRLVESGLLQAATDGLAEARPCVLISRPTELFKGFLAGASARRPSDKNQQQFARALLGVAAFSVFFIALYRRDAGKAVSAFATVLCLGAPLAGALISALPAHLMQRSAEQVGAVIPGWHDIRQLGRINVICLSARDLFPSGCVRLSGLKPVRKENIDRAIVYAASLLADGEEMLRDIFLGMIGDRKLLAKVEERQSLYGKGCVGWVEGQRVLLGNRQLMEEYDIRLPSVEYEQRHTVNQRRFVYLAVSGKLYCVFQLAYQCDADTAAVVESLRQSGLSLVVDSSSDFNCDAAMLAMLYNLPAGTVKVLTAEERQVLEPATAWLPESSGNMLHMGSFASFVGGLEAAAGAAEGERRASMVLAASVIFSAVLALVLTIPANGLTGLPLLGVVLYQTAWAVLALIFPVLQRY